MNKMDVITKVAQKSHLSKKDAESAITALIETIQDALCEGDRVLLMGFGTFEVRDRAARKGRNPQTKEEIYIEASRAPVFKAGKLLKDAVNQTVIVPEDPAE